MSSDLSAYKVASHETLSSSKFDNLVQAVQDALNAIGDASLTAFASGLIFDPAKIMQSGATSGQVLAWNGSAFAPTSAPGTSYRKLTENDVANTVTETDLLNNEITVGGGVMSTNRMVRLAIGGDYLNNTGSNATVTLKVKLGSTTLWNSGASDSIAANANRRPFRMTVEIVNLGATNSQFMTGSLWVGSASAPTTGLGVPTLQIVNGQGLLTSFATNGAVAVDTTSSQILAVTCTHSAASAALSMRLKYALAEVV